MDSESKQKLKLKEEIIWKQRGLNFVKLNKRVVYPFHIKKLIYPGTEANSIINSPQKKKKMNIEFLNLIEDKLNIKMPLTVRNSDKKAGAMRDQIMETVQFLDIESKHHM